MSSIDERADESFYLEKEEGATALLTEEVMAKIEAEGPISFHDFFSLVLYEPSLGYYSRSERVRTGQMGDFFTSVSVGSLFGRIVSQYALQQWEQLGKPSVFQVVEWGAEQGDLARDVLAGVGEVGGEFEAAVSYAIVEPILQKREDLAERLPQVQVVGRAVELESELGLVISNELIDALPFYLIRWEKGQWWEKRVTGQSLVSGFEFVLVEPEGELAERLAILEGCFSEGYETEIRLSQAPLITEMASVLEQGEIVFFDYGFERGDYYHPARTTGTIRTYGKHQAGEDPLESIGQLDITAHVDFTALAEDASTVGLVGQSLESQGRFLTRAATRLLQELDGRVDPEFIRQFQTLTHPGHLGTKFFVFRASKP